MNEQDGCSRPLCPMCWCLLLVSIRQGLRRGGAGTQRLIRALLKETGSPTVNLPLRGLPTHHPRKRCASCALKKRLFRTPPRALELWSSEKYMHGVFLDSYAVTKDLSSDKSVHESR